MVTNKDRVFRAVNARIYLLFVKREILILRLNQRFPVNDVVRLCPCNRVF